MMPTTNVTPLTTVIPAYTVTPAINTPTFPEDIDTYNSEVPARIAAENALKIELNTMIGQLNTLETNVVALESSTVSAQSVAVAVSHFMGTWVNQTTVIPQSWEYGGIVYMVLIPGNTSPIASPSNWLALNVASDIKNTPTGNIVATTVQGALNELDNEKQAIAPYYLGTKATDIASASTVSIGGVSGDNLHITGTTTITGLGTATANVRRTVIFDGALTLTHNATSLILPTGANIITAAGDIAEFVCENGTSGYWRCTGYQRKDGTALKTNALTFSDIPAGGVIQVANYSTGAMATTTSLIPIDNTIPQISEGTQFMSLAFTPKKANSKLKIETVFNGGIAIAGYTMIVALFRDATVNAIGVGTCVSSANRGSNVVFTTYIDAVSITLTTFTVRGGLSDASTLTFNGVAGGQLFSGLMASSITITEIAQ